MCCEEDKRWPCYPWLSSPAFPAHRQATCALRLAAALNVPTTEEGPVPCRHGDGNRARCLRAAIGLLRTQLSSEVDGASPASAARLQGAGDLRPPPSNRPAHAGKGEDIGKGTGTGNLPGAGKGKGIYKGKGKGPGKKLETVTE